MAEYDGSIELISGITQKNGGTFPLVDASAVQIDESGTRLNGWIKTLNASALILGEQDMWVRDSAQPSEFIYHATPIAPFSPSTAYVIKTACENNDAEIWIRYEYSQEWHEAHPSSEGGVQVIKDTGAGLQNKAFTTKSISDGVVSIVKVTAKGFTEEEIANTNIVPYNTTYSVAESGYAIAAGESSHAEGRGTKALAPFSHVEGSGTSAGVSVMSNKGNSAHAEGSNTIARGNYSHSEGQHTSAQGSYSHAEGNSTLAQGNGAHAEGYGALGTKEINNTTYNESGAYGNYSHTEGSGTWAVGANSHAEGHETVASSSHSHAEGDGTEARGESSHAEGQCTIANHLAQHVFGRYNIEDPSNAASNALGNYIEIVGNGTSNSARSNARTLDKNGNEVLAGTLTVGTAPTANMHVATKQYVDNAMGVNDAMVFRGTIGSSGATVSSLPATHKTGWAYKVSTAGSYAGFTCEVGDLIICVEDGTSANNAHWTVVQNNIEPDVYAVKNNPVFTGSISMGRNSSSTVGGNSVATGYNAEATGNNSFATGYKARATATGANAEGIYTLAANQYAHAEGRGDTSATQTVDDVTYTGSGAYGKYSHAEGSFTWAIGEDSHAEGISAVATGAHSHAEGMGSQASGSAAHAEGGGIATGADSHAEGVATASGNYSHAENGSTASGHYSHAEGLNTIANHASQHVFGTYNVEDPSTKAANLKGTYVEIVGKGTGNNDRSNARTLDWAGNEVLAGKLTVGINPTNNMDVATKQYVDTAIANEGAIIVDFGTLTADTYTEAEFTSSSLDIDSSYKAISVELGDASAVSSPILVKTGNGAVYVTATLTKSTTMKVVLIKCAKTVVVEQTEMAPEEEEIIPG